VQPDLLKIERHMPRLNPKSVHTPKSAITVVWSDSRQYTPNREYRDSEGRTEQHCAKHPHHRSTHVIAADAAERADLPLTKNAKRMF
jgi:hypothetical protein